MKKNITPKPGSPFMIKPEDPKEDDSQLYFNKLQVICAVLPAIIAGFPNVTAEGAARTAMGYAEAVIAEMEKEIL